MRMLQLMIESSNGVIGLGKAESTMSKYKHNNNGILDDKNDSNQSFTLIVT